jgi:hypothetical protein
MSSSMEPASVTPDLLRLLVENREEREAAVAGVQLVLVAA